MKKKELLYSYVNGDLKVHLYKDGTKVWIGEGKREFPDSMDVKITNYCDAGCSYCHEKSTVKGKHGSLDYFLEEIQKLPKGIEIAIGGGNPLSHPDIIYFLKSLKEMGYIPNITVNAFHQHLITKEIEDNVYGIGLSVNKNIEVTYTNKNLVLHFIAGIHDVDLIEAYLNKGYKCLILGYKNWGRGKAYRDTKKIGISMRIQKLIKKLPELKGQIAFDSLGVHQLQPQSFLDKDYWDLHYTGEDGRLSMYFDLVEGKFCKNSFAEKRYNFNTSISDAFQIILNEEK